MTITDELLAIAKKTACAAVAAREAVLELKQAASQMDEQPPGNDKAIRQVAKAYGIPVRHRQIKHIVLNLTDVLLEEISSADLRESKTALAFAPERELRDWQREGIVPASAYHEAAMATSLASEAPEDDVVARQLKRCELAHDYPASLVAHIARAALSGDTSPALGAFQP